MSPTATDPAALVDDFVRSLTYHPTQEDGTGASLREQMLAASREFDDRTADAVCRGLLGALCEDPGDVRRLEALILLGLARPELLDRHRISLRTEADRLIVLLQQRDEGARAASLAAVMTERGHRETPRSGARAPAPVSAADADDLIERYLRSADTAAGRGRVREAVGWLQEALRVDPGRRDIARMIRDLRYHDRRKRLERVRFGKILAGAAVLVAVGGLFVWRERDIAARYTAIPETSEDDLAGLRQRLSQIERLIGSEKAWIGMLPVLAEREDLRLAVRILQEKESRAAHQLAATNAETLEQLEALRQRALLYVQQGELDLALVDLKNCLDRAPQNWVHRTRVRADVEAIESFRREDP